MKKLILLLVCCVLLGNITSCNLPTVPEITASPEVSVLVVNTATTEKVLPTATNTAEPPPPTDIPQPVIEHVMLPAYGEGKAQTIHDQTSDKTAPEKRAYGGDEFIIGRYERPFTREQMEYLPFIDLVRADLYRDTENTWAYVTLEVITPPALAGEHAVYYGLELDDDLDGRGDSLIIAKAPESAVWTTAGVQVWRDINNSVGATQAMKPDTGGGADGYELLIFDEGKGDDTDLAWVRLNPDQSNRIEIAFKLSLVDTGEDAILFLWGAWSFADAVHPDWFDHHDTFTLEEAGSPLKESAAYPLKSFAAADNTCRALSGMEPTGALPGMCPYTPPKTTNNNPGGQCTPINCCTSLTTACMLYFNMQTCQCEPK